MNSLEPEKLDSMRGGMFNNRSYFGYKTSVLKSGICKYYRRKMFDKFEWCVVEMLLFSIKNSGLYTNLINRLKILLMEEIIFTELGPIIQCIKILNNMKDLDFDGRLNEILKFCSIVKTCKRGRIVSYINNYYKNYIKNENLECVVLNEVLKYRKKNDSDELLKYGQLFINYIKEFSIKSKAFNIFNLLMKNKEIKCGTRYRRKEPVYILFEIIENEFLNDIDSSLSQFTREMFFRKSMTERPAFGIWYICMAWKHNNSDFNNNFVDVVDVDVNNYITNRLKIDINEDFVVNDYHVSKKYTLAKFGNVGSLVIDEDLTELGENGEKWRKFYVDVKNGKKVPKTLKIKSDIPKKVDVKNGKKEPTTLKIKSDIPKKTEHIVDESKLEFINWDEFEDVTVLEDGVCGLKVCCIMVKYNDKYYILKEMRDSFNKGRDYMFIDSLKKEFGILDLGMKRITSNKRQERKDLDKKSLVKNWKLVEKETIYCMMDEFTNIGDIGKHKHLLADINNFRECLKIRLYDGLFRSSDNILRNILVNSESKLMSIDEGDIFGKRKVIFNKNDYFNNKKNISRTREEGIKIIDEWDLNNKKVLVKKTMVEFKFNDKVSEMEERFSNFKAIFLDELKSM